VVFQLADMLEICQLLLICGILCGTALLLCRLDLVVLQGGLSGMAMQSCVTATCCGYQSATGGWLPPTLRMVRRPPPLAVHKVSFCSPKLRQGVLTASALVTAEISTLKSQASLPVSSRLSGADGHTAGILR